MNHVASSIFTWSGDCFRSAANAAGVIRRVRCLLAELMAMVRAIASERDVGKKRRVRDAYGSMSVVQTLKKHDLDSGPDSHEVDHAGLAYHSRHVPSNMVQQHKFPLQLV